METILDREPREMASVSPELWQLLRDLWSGRALHAEFHSAWANGQAFFFAREGLRERRPVLIEWKGGTGSPGDEVAPVDLRVDHVYLISCKYLSRIVMNASPSHLFERLLVGGHGVRSGNWFQQVAPEEFDRLYTLAVAVTGLPLPADVRQLTRVDGRALSQALRGRWPSSMLGEATEFAAVVAARSADAWIEAMERDSAKERLLWRLLRIGSAPYFVLGVDRASSLRLRIETPWDWRQRYRLVQFIAEPQMSGQPVVSWKAFIEDRRTRGVNELAGHVEIRWSHGKFNGSPEAKVYLDTPHHRVPGYVTIA